MKLTDVTFQEVVKPGGQPTAVLIGSQWSGNSYLMKSIVEQIKEQFSNGVVFYEMDVGSGTKVIDTYRIGHFPTILLFSKGILVDRINEMVSEKELIERIKAFTRNRPEKKCI
jgi:thioredoxin-like negative regulator of GroEL